jgi:hypothetical protein
MRFSLRNCFQHLVAATLLTAASVGLLILPTSAALVKNSPKQQADGLAQAKDDRSVYAEIAKAPENARSKRNPFENDADAVTAGRKLFVTGIIPIAQATGRLLTG